MPSIRLLLTLFLISLSSSKEPDVCVTGSAHDYLDGVYVWQSDINSNLNGVVYYCTSCSVDVYLYPSILYGTDFYWIFGPDHRSRSGYGICYLGYMLGSDYHFNLSVCVGDWDYWSDYWSDWVDDNNIEVENCPTPNPTQIPTPVPTLIPTVNPSVNPTVNPTANPSLNPTQNPSINPTPLPTQLPTPAPSNNPTNIPTLNNIPTTKAPTIKAMAKPTLSPNIHQLTTLESDQTSTRYISNETQNESGAEFWDVIWPILAMIILCIVIGIFVFIKIQKQKQKLEKQSTVFGPSELNMVPVTIPDLNKLRRGSTIEFYQNNENENDGSVDVKQEGVLSNTKTTQQEQISSTQQYPCSTPGRAPSEPHELINDKEPDHDDGENSESENDTSYNNAQQDNVATKGQDSDSDIYESDD